MKRKLFCFILAVVTCFLTSCQTKLNEPETLYITETEEDRTVKTYPKVGKPLTWEQIEAIPVANNHMSSDELRKICTDFMRLQLTFEWTPIKSMSYFFETRNYMMEFPEGRVYGGLPYKTFDGNGNIYIVMDFYDPETGILDPGSVTTTNIFSIIGNDCATGPYWAWARVINSITNYEDFKLGNGFTNIGLTPENNLIPVGGYESITEGTFDDGDGTKAVCESNGKQKIFECYAQALPADGLLHFYPKSEGSRQSHNHLMMVSSKANVVRNEDGTINGDKSTITILDQESHKTREMTENGMVHYEGGVDTVFTFSKLYDEYYIPFTFKEFLKTDPVEKAEFRLEVNGDAHDYETLRGGTLRTNYGISHLRIKFYDPTGKELYASRVIPEMVDTTNFKMEDLLRPNSKWHAKEENTCVITAFLGTGEEFEIFRGSLILNKN